MLRRSVSVKITLSWKFGAIKGLISSGVPQRALPCSLPGIVLWWLASIHKITTPATVAATRPQSKKTGDRCSPSGGVSNFSISSAASSFAVRLPDAAVYTAPMRLPSQKQSSSTNAQPRYFFFWGVTDAHPVPGAAPNVWHFLRQPVPWRDCIPHAPCSAAAGPCPNPQYSFPRLPVYGRCPAT